DCKNKPRKNYPPALKPQLFHIFLNILPDISGKK
ncbi:unnamed protein product, partial [marine sediment metagenome]